jgi:hypothetical protein
METITEQHHEHMSDEEKKNSTQIRSVAATLYERVDLNKPTVEFLREHFYKDPALALAYYYCCSTDPCVTIFNNELQLDVNKSVIWNRISNLIGSPIGREEAMLCQETFNNLDQSHARIAACASCCECLLSADGQQGIVEMKIDDLPSEFLLTELQIERMTTLPQYIVQNHIQVVNHNGTFYHLNPDLVFDVNQIVLCRVCAENPMTKVQESIAAHNDYGQLGSLKPLNGTTRNACEPVGLYNIDLQIQANHSTNHCIAFPMNGPMECLKKLPCVDEKYCPQVTFLGPRDEWMKKAGKYKYLYKMDTEIAYNWLQVWVNANHPSFQNCIIDTSDNVCDEMNRVTEKIIEEAIPTTDPDIVGISSMLDAKDEEKH